MGELTEDMEEAAINMFSIQQDIAGNMEKK